MAKGKQGSRKKPDSLKSLDVRKRKYVAGRLAGKSKKASALEAGYSHSMAKNAAAKIETQSVRKAFHDLVQKAVPAAKIVKRLREGLDATWVHQDGKRGATAEPYYRERREYLILAAKLGGYFVEKKSLEAEVKLDEAELAAQRERVLERLRAYVDLEVAKRMQAIPDRPEKLIPPQK